MCQKCVWRSKETGITKNKIKKSENKIIRVTQDRIYRDIENLYEQVGDYCKPVRVGNFYSNNYIEYKNNGDRNKKTPINQRIR